MNNMIKQKILVMALAGLVSPVYAGDAVEASMQALGYTMEAGFKMVSGAAAIPLVSVGEIGAVSGEIGAELMEEAATPPGQYQADEAFPLTDEVVTAGPAPAEELNKQLP